MTRGLTLLEMMVAVLVLGVLTAVSGLAIRSLDLPAEAEAVRELQATREAAIRTGRPQVWKRDAYAVRFLPDGSSSGGRIVVSGRTVVIDPVTGALREAN